MTARYDDIIDLLRPALKHPRMPRINRAAQFAPFAALTGHEEAVRETARLWADSLEERKNSEVDMQDC